VLVHAPVANQEIHARFARRISEAAGAPAAQRVTCETAVGVPGCPQNVECSSTARSGCGITLCTLSTYGPAHTYVVSLATSPPSSESFTSSLARPRTTADPSAPRPPRAARAPRRLLSRELAAVAAHGVGQVSQHRGVAGVDVLVQQRREHLLLGEVLDLVAQLEDRALQTAAQ
jgi:hypothetical protein